MKRTVFLLAVILLLTTGMAMCETASNWTDAPVITKAYEIESGKLYLEWQGNAILYQVYMDGESVASVIVNNAVIPLKNGSHMIYIFPIYETKAADTSIDFDINSKLGSGGVRLDLAALGIDPKKLTAGNPSEVLSVDYTPDPIFNAAPDQLAAEMDFGDRVHLSFTDRYNADEYLITIKNRNDVNYVRFRVDTDGAAQFISKAGSAVSLTLDREFLEKQGCMVPELNEKYTFTVQLRKYAVNMITVEKETMVIHESKVSKGYDYTPEALWKTAPVITYASQTAEGEITIKWDHDDNDMGCEYVVYKIKKTLGVKTGEEVWGTTAENEFVVKDLMNGGYTVAVMPRYMGEKGKMSGEAKIDVKNDWITAPALSCSQADEGQVQLIWPVSPNVEAYHITVYTGSGSLLRFVNMDFRKYAEFEVPAVGDEIVYLYTYDGEYDPAEGVRLKFEIYAVRRTADGQIQKSETSSKTITLR